MAKRGKRETKPAPDQHANGSAKKAFVKSPISLQRLSSSLGREVAKTLPTNAPEVGHNPDWHWIPDDITNRNQLAYLMVYGLTGNHHTTARVANVSRTSHDRWSKTDKKYRRAFEMARRQSVLVLEEALFQRGVIGFDKPVWHKGEQIGTERQYSDACLHLALKANAPNKYREHKTIEHTGPGGGPILIAAVRDHVDRIMDDDKAAELASSMYERLGIQPALEVKAEVVESTPEKKNGKRNGRSNGTAKKPSEADA